MELWLGAKRNNHFSPKPVELLASVTRQSLKLTTRRLTALRPYLTTGLPLSRGRYMSSHLYIGPDIPDLAEKIEILCGRFDDRARTRPMFLVLFNWGWPDPHFRIYHAIQVARFRRFEVIRPFQKQLRLPKDFS